MANNNRWGTPNSFVPTQFLVQEGNTAQVFRITVSEPPNPAVTNVENITAEGSIRGFPYATGDGHYRVHQLILDPWDYDRAYVIGTSGIITCPKVWASD